MGQRLIVLAVLLAGMPHANAQSTYLQPVSNQVSVRAVRVSIDILIRGGASKERAKSAVAVLLAWMADAHTLNDEALGNAVIPAAIMLSQGTISTGELSQICAVAPKCDEYMAVGHGLSPVELQRRIRRGEIQSELGLAKMFAVARNRHVRSDAYRIIAEALVLPPSIKEESSSDADDALRRASEALSRAEEAVEKAK